MARKDFEWDQGADLGISITYKIDNEPVDLTGYKARMDIAKPSSAERVASLYTFNTDDDDVVTHDEITLYGDGLIYVEVPRSLTLDGGPIYSDLENATQVKYIYDLFLRDVAGRQRKILQGEITVLRSVTLWM